jgi:hypothetical protein
MQTKPVKLFDGIAISGAKTTFGNFMKLADYANPDGSFNLAFNGGAMVGLVAPSIASGTIDIKLQGSFSGLSADAFDLRAVAGPSGAMATFPAITAPATNSYVLDGPLPVHVRAVAVSAGAGFVASELDLFLQCVSTGNT